MLLEYMYLLPNFDASFLNDAETEKSEFIFPINEQITRSNAEVFQTLLKSKILFCFYIPFQLTRESHTFFQGEAFRNIIRLLFLPNSVRVDHKIVFFTEKLSVESKRFEEFKKKFYNELRKQGIDEFIVEALKPAQSSRDESAENSISLYDHNLNTYLNGTEEECFQIFFNSPAFSENFYKKWIVPVANKDDFRSKIKLIEKFEKWIWDTHPFSAKLFALEKLARQDITKLKSDNSILRFKLQSSGEALDLIRKESAGYIGEVSRLRNELQRGEIEAEKRANEIKGWYHREYEALPLWYKRLGHIIKVLTGKRTFKSLFK
jgi:hypothetical protein